MGLWLRPLFHRRPELLGELARAGAEAVRQLLRHASGEADPRPGIVVSVARAAAVASAPAPHPSDGGRSPDAAWHSPAEWDAGRLMRQFRERLLGSLLDQRAISQELVQKPLAWTSKGGRSVTRFGPRSTSGRLRPTNEEGKGERGEESVVPVHPGGGGVRERGGGPAASAAEGSCAI